MKNFKINMSTFIAAICCLAALQGVVANEEEEQLSYCNQQLMLASAACSDSETLESCISKSLKNSGCEVEILNKEDVDVCNDTCAPILNDGLLESDESKENILSLTEGE